MNGAHDLAAGGCGLEQLPDKTFEGQAKAKNALAAVGSFLFRGKQMDGQKRAQLLHQEREVNLAQGLGLLMRAGGQASTQRGKEGSNQHRAV